MSYDIWKFLLLSRLVLVSCINDNIMIRDYFTYKGVASIASFSCDNIENDIRFAKVFNNIYILTSMWNFGSMVKSPTHNIRKFLHNNYRNLGVYIDARCNYHNYTMVYSEATKYFMFDEMHKWLILGKNLNDTIKQLNDNAFDIMTDVTIAVPSFDGFDFYDVYNPCKARGGSLNVTSLGTWNEEFGIKIDLVQSKFERRLNLHGMKIKVGILLPYIYHNMSTEDIMLDFNMKAKHGRSKFLFILLLHMADLFNFTMDIVEVSPKKNQDNSAPMFGAFQKKIIDISASPIIMKSEKLRMGDIIGPVWPMRSCFLFRTISSANMKTKQFLRPLNIKVWYVILGTIAGASSVLVILLRREGIRNIREAYDISILFTIGAISQQGSVFVPVHYAGRIAFLHIMLFSVLILNYYSSSVVSDRLKNVAEKMNDSLINLANSHLKLAVEPTPYIRSFLQSPEDDVRYFYEKRWERVPESQRYLSLVDGLNRVAEGGLAYHAMTDAAYPYIERHFQTRMICELTEVHLFRAVLALWARRKSPFTPLLRQGLIKMYNVGIRKRLLKRWSSRKPFCPKNMLISEPLSIQEATPIFIFLCFATIFSIVICIIECVIHWILPSRSSITARERWRLIQNNLHLYTKKTISIRKDIPSHY